MAAKPLLSAPKITTFFRITPKTPNKLSKNQRNRAREREIFREWRLINEANLSGWNLLIGPKGQELGFHESGKLCYEH